MSLVEVMIAIVILAFAVLPLLSFMRTGARGAKGTRDIGTATFLASQALERVRGWPFEQLTEQDVQALRAAGGSPGPSAMQVLNGPDEAEVEVHGVQFRRQVQIESLATNPADPDLKSVRVRVEWVRKNTPFHYEVVSAVTIAP
jgi:type II secretory pathway pseudopilin PulG